MGKKGSQEKKEGGTPFFGAEFKGLLDAIKKSGVLMVNLVGKSCVTSNPEDLEPIADDIIMNEKLVDRTKEIIIEKLHVSKSFTSDYSTADNYFVIRTLDEIEDQIELVARMFQIYSFKYPNDLRMEIIKLAKLVNKTIEVTLKSVDLFYNDLANARAEFEKVEDARREVRELGLKILKSLFDKIELIKESPRLFMIKDLIQNLVNLADIMEEFSDDLEEIALKYLHP
ncbi:MAG: DUF47 domain-containing protein [Candidatus Hodarchaeota archaeon]